MLVLKEEVVESRQLSAPDQDAIMQDVVEEVSQTSNYFFAPYHFTDRD
jgi:hypothetical protein